MNITEGEPKDAEQILAIQIRSLREISKSHYSSEDLEQWIASLTVDSFSFGLEHKHIFVARDGKKIVGFVEFKQDWGEIKELYVDPQYLRRGIGTRLLERAEATAALSGLNQLRLFSSLNAVRFYQENGYVVIASAKLPFGEKGINVEFIEMIKPLRDNY